MTTDPLPTASGAAGSWAAFAPFAGPLRAHWGETMSANALRTALSGGESRLGIPALSDRAFWNALDAPTLSALAAEAAGDVGTTWPQPLLSQFASFFRDGNRTRYEDRVRGRAERLTRAVVLAAATGEVGWLDEAADGIALACEQTGWSWAAHDDVFAAHGEVVPRDASPYLDLGAGELAAQLAWADHVLGAALDARVPGLRARIREQVRRRVFEPFLTRRDWHWLGLDGDVHNWSPWIHGNVIAAAVLLSDDAAERAELVARSLDGIDRYVATLPSDGATDEGFAYWWNGACRALEALDLVRRATRGTLDASGVGPLAATVSFPHRMHLGGERYVNVADGSGLARGGEPWHVPFAWGRRVGDEDAARHALAQKTPGAPLAPVSGGLGRLLHALADRGWAAGHPAAAPLVARSWLASIEVLLVRERAGTAEGLAFALKGGHNGEHHNHLDLGSVIVALDGVPVVADAGKTTYTAQTFGPRRYEIRAMQSSWHAAPAPYGLEQGVGSGFRAELIGVDDTGAEFELAGAYPLAAGASWRRAVRLDRAARAVTVTDAWALTGASGAPAPDAPAIVHYLLRADPERIGDTALRVTVPGAARAAIVEWDRPEASVVLDDWDLDDPALTAVWGPRLTRLTLALHEPGGRLTVTVRAATEGER
ncbi:MAG: heparinase II/III family protein [Microbacteriaceae bacterium]|nr:heparinase II/III family protein [Microbacteriaceae bacterium]